jgi:hypothetical protein
MISFPPFLTPEPTPPLTFRYARSTRVVTEGTEAILERLGRYHRKLKPGLNFVVPFIDKIVFIETVREQILDLPPEIVIAKDNVSLSVDLVLYWRIEDLVRTYYSVEDFEVALSNAVITKFRQNAAQLDSEEIALNLTNIGDLLLNEVNKSAENWGVKVTNLDLNIFKQNKIDVVADKTQINHEQPNEKLLASNTISIDLPGEINWIAYQRTVEDLSKKGLQIIIQDWKTLDSGDKVSKSVAKIKYLPVSLERDEVYSAFLIDYGTRRIELDSSRFERQKNLDLDIEDEFKEDFKKDVKSMFQQIQVQMQTLILSSSREIKTEINNYLLSRSTFMESDQSQNFKVGQDFTVNAADSVISLRDISGTVTKTINQLPSSSDSGNPGIKELLTQLQNAIEAESELPHEDKAEALEQIKTLAKAGQKPEDNALQKAAKTSMKILKGTVASLPDAAKLIEACAKLLPAIASLLALV